MPVISRFFGITIRMYWDDHNPPHFHAYYEDDGVLINIFTGEILEGSINKRALTMAQEWASLYKKNLLENWELSKQRKPLKRIPPLE